ncbi:ATP synthase subunit s, mitochondrial-like [Ptychodera flava]|uniref:ATP synthase subunit s, mitochondrial-like n=1 Tax=Ptychodera flava TaxID=63121 RepID=UPI00396A70EF
MMFWTLLRKVGSFSRVKPFDLVRGVSIIKRSYGTVHRTECALFGNTRVLNASKFSPNPTKFHRRHLFGILNAIFNRVDYGRISEVGPDRAAAEWLLRCGAHVKFKDFNKWNVDYNVLPTGPPRKYKIEAVDATDSSIMHIGFPHFKDLDCLRSLKLHHCTYLTDECMSALHYLKDTLEDLQVSSCGDISDKGLIALHQLKKLKTLFLCDLPAVKDMDVTIDTLRMALPQCEITYLSLEGLKDLKKLKDLKEINVDDFKGLK